MCELALSLESDGGTDLVPTELMGLGCSACS